MKKKFALAGAMAFAAAGVGVFGFAPASSAQTIGGCANPDVCGFINASGFSILGFANGSFGFIRTSSPFIGAGTNNQPLQTFNTAAAPTAAPSAQRTAAPSLGQWSMGSLPVAAPNRGALLASLPQNVRLANSSTSASNGVDAATAAPVVIGLMGLYGVLTFAVRRRATAAS